MTSKWNHKSKVTINSTTDHQQRQAVSNTHNIKLDSLWGDSKTPNSRAQHVNSTLRTQTVSTVWPYARPLLFPPSGERWDVPLSYGHVQRVLWSTCKHECAKALRGGAVGYSTHRLLCAHTHACTHINKRHMGGRQCSDRSTTLTFLWESPWACSG